ncbi:hypothetical protein EXE58_04930 [Nocardioides seonyuensis]|uniref:Transaldolase n=1 Tax=Nocardioides seonyuensis TaxID=2518371 RepID=A0A4P7IGL0_9ACTN|nr:hypothetical protein [Nocardioides seonyuensis]QBX54871.1 hypothetical protein EXE58_04930 [Nocardioides seonyuensis]
MSADTPPSADLPHASLPEPWRALVDDAAVFPPGNAPLDDALSAFEARQEEWFAELVGSFVVRDTDLGSVPASIPVSVVLSTGAGAVEGVVRQAAKRGLRLAGLELALNDLQDLAGNVRRVDAAVRAVEVDAPVFIEIPGPATAAWLAAADEVAACDHRLKLRLGNLDHDLVPDSGTVAAWIDAALDRETRFKATAGLHRAVRHDPEGGGAHGFLNVMAATQALWDGGSAAEAAQVLEQRDGATLAATDLSAARRWFTSFGSCSVTEPLDDLTALGLLEMPQP